MASNYTMFSHLIPSIPFGVYMMYLHEALQMPKMIKKLKGLQLGCKLVRYGFTEISHTFSMEYKICTDKLPAAATVHFPGAK